MMGGRRLDWAGSWQEPMSDPFEYDNEYSGLIKGWEFD
jgi:hypothetical protein